MSRSGSFTPKVSKLAMLDEDQAVTSSPAPDAQSSETPLRHSTNPLMHDDEAQPLATLRCVAPNGATVRAGVELKSEKLEATLERGMVIEVLEKREIDVADEEGHRRGRTQTRVRFEGAAVRGWLSYTNTRGDVRGNSSIVCTPLSTCANTLYICVSRCCCKMRRCRGSEPCQNTKSVYI